jgi:hypothetical protein
MMWMTTKTMPATTATNATARVVTRAASDTGYHLVSVRHPMHTVAAVIACARTRLSGTGGQLPAGGNPQARCRLTHLIVTAKGSGTQHCDA